MDRKHTQLAQLGLSALIIVGGSYVALGEGYPPLTREFAMGMVGLVVGYWFKSPLQE